MVKSISELKCICLGQYTDVLYRLVRCYMLYITYLNTLRGVTLSMVGDGLLIGSFIFEFRLSSFGRTCTHAHSFPAGAGQFDLECDNGG